MWYSDLLEKMRRKDPDAFLEMTDKYGWAVYSAIREKQTDQAAADKIYNETMNTFYQSVQSDSAEDPLEAMLCAYASQVCARYAAEGSRTGRAEAEDSAPPRLRVSGVAQPERTGAAKGNEKNGFWYGLGILVVLAAIAVVLWCIIGLLMDMQLLPDYDLGFSWFNTHVMPLF